MVGIFKKIHLMPKFQVRKYCSTTVQPPIFHLVQIQNWLFGPDLAQLWPNFGPTLAQLWPNFGPFDPFCHWCRLK